MKRKEIFTLLFLSIFVVVSVCYFAGCGDDGSVTFNSTQGATGATGETGPTGPSASLTVNVWTDDERTTAFQDAFTVILERIAESTVTSELESFDTIGEGTVTITDLTPGNYRIYIQALGYLEQTDEVELPSETAKITVDVDFILKPEERVFYAFNLPAANHSLSSSSLPSTGIKQFFIGNKFYGISLSTGEASFIADVDKALITGLAFSPENKLYALGVDATNASLSREKKQAVDNYWALYEIDPFTGVLTIITGLTGDVPPREGYNYLADLTFAPDGKLYAAFVDPNDIDDKGLDSSQTSLGDTIVEINISTGAVTKLSQPSNYPPVPDYSYSMSIGFAGSSLYFLRGNDYSDTSRYYQWNNYTGASSLTEINSDVGYNYFCGLEYYNESFYTVGNTYSNEPAVLLSIDPATGNTTAIGNVRDELDNPLYGIYDIATP